MTGQVDRRSLVRWLLAHGFTEIRGRASGHRRFAHPTGITITSPGHGPQDITKKHVGMILRELERAGFDKDQARRELSA